MPAIKHLFHVKASPQKVFEALCDTEALSAWYTTKVEGQTKLNTELHFYFGEMRFNVVISEIIPNERLEWTCLESAVPVEGHRIIFQLIDKEDKTQVQMIHLGYEQQDDAYANMNYSWAKYLESLRQYCQTGQGEAFGSPHYRI